VGTRDLLLANGAALFATKGFHGVGVEELGESIGLTGPSIYRHFRTKGALLAEMLITVSQSLLEGATEVTSQNLEPAETLNALINKHIDFALTYPDLIRVHERDFSNLEEEDARQVRRLQRRYLEVWVDQIMQVRPKENSESAHTLAHAIFGALNSTPRIRSNQRRHEVAEVMLGLAQRALLS
jgi:AcrR family transcriptional regulator